MSFQFRETDDATLRVKAGRTWPMMNSPSSRQLNERLGMICVRTAPFSRELPMSSQQPPSFEHLFQPEQVLSQRSTGGFTVAGQMQRNDQLKYQRTRVASGGKQIEMPDGEVVSQTDK